MPPRGGGGGGEAMIFPSFVCLSAQRSIMRIDADNTPTPLCKFCHNFFQVGKILVSAPPPPQRPLLAHFSGLAMQHGCILPPLTIHNGAAPAKRYHWILLWAMMQRNSLNAEVCSILLLLIKQWSCTCQKSAECTKTWMPSTTARSCVQHWIAVV